jgi:hypothetical protein
VPLRIAFDLDGVLADMESELARQAEALFGDGPIRPVPPRAPEPAEAPEASVDTPPGGDGESPDIEPPPVRLTLTPRQQRKLWRHVQGIHNFWETLTEIEPGAVARLAEIASARRWEVIFLTKRPRTAGVTAQVQTQRWLNARGFSWPSVYVVQGSRGRIAAALDLSIVVDDRPENCLDVVADSKARAILVWRDDERLLPESMRRMGIGAVASMEECFSALAEIDAAPASEAGVFDRVLRLLGLKENPQAV